MLTVHSTPEAEVYLDERFRGRTPLVLEDLSPGLHDLSLVAADGRRLAERVQLAPGAALERDHRFPGFGGLSVSSDAWVEIQVDDGPPQQTPLAVPRLAAGRHTVRASRAGYRPQTHVVEIAEGQTATLRISLEREE